MTVWVRLSSSCTAHSSLWNTWFSWWTRYSALLCCDVCLSVCVPLRLCNTALKQHRIQAVRICVFLKQADVKGWLGGNGEAATVDSLVLFIATCLWLFINPIHLIWQCCCVLLLFCLVSKCKERVSDSNEHTPSFSAHYALHAYPHILGHVLPWQQHLQHRSLLNSSSNRSSN